MAYTASALSYMLENLTKPVIFTGSQLPIGQLRTDGKENLISSIEIAAACDDQGHALVPEVGIYFNSHLLRGNRTTKQSAEEFNAFESFNYPHLVDAGVNITYHRERILKPQWEQPMIPHYRLDNNVIIFSLFPGIREDLIRHIIHTPNLKAIVMRTFGSGNAPQSTWLLRALKEGTANGKVIVNISQCLQGAVEMSRYDCGYHLQEAGVISGRDMTVESAVTKLMFLQSHYPSSKGFSPQNIWRMKQFFETYDGNEKLSPLVREISWTNNLLLLSSWPPSFPPCFLSFHLFIFPPTLPSISVYSSSLLPI